MKKVMLSALLAGMFMIGSVVAQTTSVPATGKPVTTQQSGAIKTDKKGKTHKKGSKKAATSKVAAAPKASTGAAGQK